MRKMKPQNLNKQLIKNAFIDTLNMNEFSHFLLETLEMILKNIHIVLIALSTCIGLPCVDNITHSY